MDAFSKARAPVAKIRGSEELTFDLQTYERLPNGHPNKTRQALLNFMWQNTPRKKEGMFELDVNEAGRRSSFDVPNEVCKIFRGS